MFEYLREFVTAIIRRWYVPLGVFLDLIAVAALAFAKLNELTVWWPLPIVVALVLLLWASFQSFQEVRRRIETAIVVRRTGSIRGEPMIYVYDSGQIQAYVPLKCRFVNNGDDAKILRIQVLWQTRPRFATPRPVHRVPLVAWDSRSARLHPPFSLDISKASESSEFEFLFEGWWDASREDVQKLPKNARFVLHAEIAGQPDIILPLAEYGMKRGERWEVPAQDLQFEVRTNSLLAMRDSENALA
jgi:hypothetical protein